MMNWKRKARLASSASATVATNARARKVVKAKASKAAAKIVPAPTGVSPIVEVDPAEAKSGCMYCPLFPFTKRFAEGAFDYKRDAVKIQTKEIDGHTINSHNIREEWTEVDMLIVGEAPGGQEDAKGQAFIGRSGKLLREALGMLVDTPMERIGITNIIRCRPPRNRDPRKTEIKCCGYELIREIEARKPKLVVSMGNFSMEFLTGQRGITTLATRILKCIRPEFPDLTVLASLHPAYILRFDHEMEKFCKALEKADQFLKGEYVPPMGAGEYYTLDTIEDVKAVLNGFVDDGLPVAFDTECGGLSPFQTESPPLLCYSLSNKEGEGCTIPYDHVDAPWNEKEKKQVADMMREFFLSGVPLIAQNEKFDRQHILHSIDVDMPVPLRDTMTTHMILDERRGTHGLKTLAFAYTGMGGYEKPLDDYVAKHKEANPDKGGSYANIPGEILFPYAAMDADVTIRCDNAMIKSPEYRKNIRFRRLAENFLPAVGVTLADLEYAGAAIDPKVVTFLAEKYTAEMAKYEKTIKGLPKVRQFVTDTLKAGKKLSGDKFNPGSRQQLAKVLFDYYGLVPKELTNKGFEILVARHKSVNSKRKGKGAVGFDNVVRAAIRRKEWDFFSTKADVLHDYERIGNDLCPMILSYRSASTLYGTFVEPLSDFLDPLNRIHGTYWIGGTVTGRLSSSSPNLQNIPNKGGGLIKQAYVSRFGDEGLLLQLDLSQIELRIAACWYNDPAMIEAYKKGIDLHALTAADMHHMKLAAFYGLPSKEQKAKRTRAKRINFGCFPVGNTEILTRRGWKRWGDVTTRDETLGWKGGRTVWTPVREVVHYWDAPVMEMKTSNFCVETTPNHRWVAKRRRDGGSRGRYFEDVFTTTETLAKEESIYLSAPIDAEDRTGLSPEEAALVAWVLTDGHFKVSPLTGKTSQAGGRRRKTALSVFQSETANSDTVKCIDELMVHFKHSRYVRPSGIVQWLLKAEEARWLYKKFAFGEASAEALVRRMGTEQVQAFLAAARLAEGSKRDPVITQNAGDVLEAIKLAAFMCGYYVSETDNGVYRGNHNKRIRLRKPTLSGQKVERRMLGNNCVWCVRTDCETLVIRQNGRVMLTGNTLYGGGPPALQSTLKKDGVFVTVEECKEFITEFFKVRPGLRAGIDKTEKGVLKRGYLESFTGRRRRVPEVRSEDEQIVARALRQSINFPIQNGASEITLMAMVLINRELKKHNFKSRMILTVHDSLVFDCHVDEVIEVACIGKMIMENLPKLSEEILPGLNWDWLTVPIVADAEVGVTWGQMVGFDPFEVQKDETNLEALWKLEDGKKVPMREPSNIDELWDLIAWKAA